MGKVALRATVVTLLSVLISISVAIIVLPRFGRVFDTPTLIMCIACPVLIAWPISFKTQRQKHRLVDALSRLGDAHRELAATHGELALAHLRLAEKARRDDMTGLLNRETFLAGLERASRRREAGTLLIIDADDFKRINDNHGHLIGDEALVMIAEAIAGAVRERDMVGRIGGEEFGVYLVGADPISASATADRIRLAVAARELVLRGGLSLRCTVSIGGATHRSGTPVAQLMREADQRLYQAKRLGRDCAVLQASVAAAA